MSDPTELRGQPRAKGSHTLATLTLLGPCALGAIVADVAAILSEMHARGVAHGALEADQVIVDDHLRPSLDELGTTAASAGRGETHADISDLGALLRSLLTRMPMGGPSTIELRALLDIAADAESGAFDARGMVAFEQALRSVLPRELGANRRHWRQRLRRRPKPGRREASTSPASPLDTAASGLATEGNGDTSEPIHELDSSFDRDLDNEPTPFGMRRSAVAGPRSRLLLVAACGAVVAGAAAYALWGGGDRAGPTTIEAQADTSSGGGVATEVTTLQTDSSTSPPSSAAPTTVGNAPTSFPATTRDSSGPDSGGPTTGSRPPSPPAAAPGDTSPPSAPQETTVENAAGAPPSVTRGTRTYSIGVVGDIAAAGDWNCDGEVTAAILRRSENAVFVFDRWAEADEDLLPSQTLTVGPDASTLTAEPANGCHRMKVRYASGASEQVVVGQAPR